MVFEFNRIFFGLLIITLILLTYFLQLEKFFFIFVVLITSFELYKTKIYKKINILITISLFFFTVIFSIYFNSHMHYLIFIILPILLFDYFKKIYSNEFFIVFLFLFFFSIAYLYEIKSNLIYLIILISFINDSSAYLSGKLLKGPLILPKISPKKTWSGTITSFLISFFILLYFKYSIFISLILSLSLFIGDLYFSLIKRRNNLKDFSNIIPGHGGILDRLDSMTIFTMILFLSYKI